MIKKSLKKQTPTPKQVYEEKQKKWMKKQKEQKAGKKALWEAKKKVIKEKGVEGWNKTTPMGDGEDRWDVKDVVKIVHKGIAKSDARKRSKKTYK